MPYFLSSPFAWYSKSFTPHAVNRGAINLARRFSRRLGLESLRVSRKESRLFNAAQVCEAGYESLYPERVTSVWRDTVLEGLGEPSQRTFIHPSLSDLLKNLFVSVLTLSPR